MAATAEAPGATPADQRARACVRRRRTARRAAAHPPVSPARPRPPLAHGAPPAPQLLPPVAPRPRCCLVAPSRPTPSWRTRCEPPRAGRGGHAPWLPRRARVCGDAHTGTPGSPRSNGSVELTSAELAAMVCSTLEVDPEVCAGAGGGVAGPLVGRERAAVGCTAPHSAPRRHPWRRSSPAAQPRPGQAGTPHRGAHAAHVRRARLRASTSRAGAGTPRKRAPAPLLPPLNPPPRAHSGFAATELRLLRAAVSAFYDLLALAVRTAERFGGEGGGAACAPGTGSAAAAAAGGGSG